MLDYLPSPAAECTRDFSLPRKAAGSSGRARSQGRAARAAARRLTGREAPGRRPAKHTESRGCSRRSFGTARRTCPPGGCSGGRGTARRTDTGRPPPRAATLRPVPERGLPRALAAAAPGSPVAAPGSPVAVVQGSPAAVEGRAAERELPLGDSPADTARAERAGAARRSCYRQR